MPLLATAPGLPYLIASANCDRRTLDLSNAEGGAVAPASHADRGQIVDRTGGADTKPVKKPQAKLRDIWPHIRPYRLTLVVIAIVSLVATGFTLVQPLVLQTLINDLSAGQDITSVVWILIAVTIGMAGFGALQSFLLNRTAEGVVLGTRRTLVGHLFRLPIVEFDRRRIGDLMSRVGADTTLFRSVITSGLFDVVSSVLMFFGAVILMATIDVVLLAITLAAIAIGTAVVLVLGLMMRRASQRAQEGVGDMTAAVERVLGAIRSVRAAGATERETERVGGEADKVYRHGVRLAALNALVQPVMSITIQGAFVAVLGFGGYRVVTGAMEIGDLIAFLLYLFVLIMPIGGAISAIAQLQAGLAALDRMQEVLRLPVEDADEAALRSRPTITVARTPPEAVVLEFDGVGFSYEEGPPVLTDVSFRVERGSRTAIVGPSGAGKSTILALIERFYDPTSGRVLFEGADARTLRRTDLRRRIAYVEQEAPVLAGTLADNLRLANPDATDADMLAALEEVGLTSLTERAESGLGVQVGDGGVLLSGGQRQRLAWARAFLAGAELLLLDEPTSSVDSRTEAALQESLRRAGRDRTVVVVAHRLATVADSDAIVVLEQGTVQAIGTHTELLTNSPLYRELARHQLLA